MNGLQHGAFAHTEKQAIKGPKIILPVDAAQLQLKQPDESIETQFKSQTEASNGGQPPAPWPPDV